MHIRQSRTNLIRALVVSLVITSSQCRAARGLLGWNQEDLATRAGVSQVTVHQLEAGVTQPRRATLDVIRRAFENAGVEFIDENGGGPGVRLRKTAESRQRK
jgi:transcriptional regulator with XRE-family HTH domain